jgi:hypothetical protein
MSADYCYSLTLSGFQHELIATQDEFNIFHVPLTVKDDVGNFHPNELQSGGEGGARFPDKQ